MTDKNQNGIADKVESFGYALRIIVPSLVAIAGAACIVAAIIPGVNSDISMEAGAQLLLAGGSIGALSRKRGDHE